MAHHGRTVTATLARSATDERTDNELLAAYAAGETEAFGEFTRRYQAFIVATAAKRIGAGGSGNASWHDAEDAAAEAWIRIMAKVGELGPDGVGDVKSWLAAYVHNNALQITSEYARRRTPARDPHVLGEVISAHGYRLPGASGPTDDEPQDDQTREAREARADMLATRFSEALSGLAPLQREVMTRRLHDRDLTARQIAAELGRTLHSVKGAELNGRRNLRRALGDLVGEVAPVNKRAAVDPTRAYSPRRLLLIERLQENPQMDGPQARRVLEAAGLGPLSPRAARKILTKARASRAKADQPDGTPTAQPTKASVKPAQLRAARLALLIDRVRQAPEMSGVEAHAAVDDAGLGPIAGRTTRRLLAEARARVSGADQS